MIGIRPSLRAYEEWLRQKLPAYVVEADLQRKRERLKADAFTFLRGACWRWAELAPELCPEFMTAPEVVSLGDAHIENFGLWRDAEARLVWGANDFDEVALTPYPLDIVRLCASAILVGKRPATDIVTAVLAGYSAALESPKPFVLERENLWLRDLFAIDDEGRANYWEELAGARSGKSPKHARKALAGAIPQGVEGLRHFPRRAGVGSLGRARFAAFGYLYGAPIAREAKAIAPSCWTRVRKEPAADGLALAQGRHRAPDPHLHSSEGFVLRRLAPNSRKLERKGGEFPLRRRLLRAMGAEIGNLHAADEAGAGAILEDLSARDLGSFVETAKCAAAAAATEWRNFIGT